MHAGRGPRVLIIRAGGIPLMSTSEFFYESNYDDGTEIILEGTSDVDWTSIGRRDIGREGLFWKGRRKGGGSPETSKNDKFAGATKDSL